MTDQNLPNDIEKDLVELEALKQQFAEWEADRTLRPLKPTDIVYLLDQMPFLQMVNVNYENESDASFKVARAASGWDVHDYGDALASSPGRLLFGLGRRSASEDDAGDDGNGGHGTVIRQAVDTAMQMIEMAMEKNWPGVLLVDGHPLMQRAAWFKAQQLGYLMQGYTPSDNDYAWAKLIERAPEQIEEIKQRLVISY